MQPPSRLAAGEGRSADDEGTAIECLILEGCHTRDAYREHPCDAHAAELLHARTALIAAVTGASPEFCDDVLGVIAELDRLLTADHAGLPERGAA